MGKSMFIYTASDSTSSPPLPQGTGLWWSGFWGWWAWSYISELLSHEYTMARMMKIISGRRVNNKRPHLKPCILKSSILPPIQPSNDKMSSSILLSPLLLIILPGTESATKIAGSTDFLINRRSRRACCCAFPAFLLPMA